MRAPLRTNKGSPIRSRSRCRAWLAAGCDSPIRSAARLTLVSLSSASSATSRLRSSEFKFMERIYIIPAIDWKNARRRAMIGNSQSMEKPPVSTEANKKLVQQIYTDSANRSGTTFSDNLADDAVWIVTGQYSWSHEFRGKDAIQN